MSIVFLCFNISKKYAFKRDKTWDKFSIPEKNAKQNVPEKG